VKEAGKHDWSGACAPQPGETTGGLTMAKETVRGWVRDARYFEDQKSFVIIVEEPESKRPLKPIQVTVSAIKQASGMTIPDDDAEAWRWFAKLLTRRSTPLTIEFEGTADKVPFRDIEIMMQNTKADRRGERQGSR